MKAGWMLAALLPLALCAQVERFDAGWEFALKDFRPTYGKVGLQRPDYGDIADNCTPQVKADKAGWSAVTLPHDWDLTLPYDEKHFLSARQGFKSIGFDFPTNSIGWYRKSFAVPKAYEGKRVFLRFDGAFRDSQCWMNGVYLGRNESGYIGRRYEITEALHYGAKDNFVCVRVDATSAEGWWYEGAGITRHVWLECVEPDGLVPDSVFISLKELKDGKAYMHVAYETFTGGAQQQDFTVDNPHLWSCEDPYLYTYELKGEKFTYGIRTVAFDANKGFLLNGKRVEIKGVCCHQDHACVGCAVPDAVLEYRLKTLKSIGVNAYRTSHNPPAPELLDLCDRLGILVLDETRMFASSGEGLDQFRRLIRRDRNHSSVIVWSLGNEEGSVQGGDLGRQIARRLQAEQRKLDPTRVCSYGGNNGLCHTGANGVVDVRGINYLRICRCGTGDGPFDRYHREHPTTPIWGTEEASTLVTRGADDYAGGRHRQMPDRDTPSRELQGWALSAVEWTTYAATRPWFAGAFVWTGFDYRGECHWPAVNNNYGIFDMCGFPKNNAFYYKARWTDEDVLHIYPHANRARDKFWVNTNCDEVELFVNGKSVGKQRRPAGVYRLEFPVKFDRGVVEAKAVRKGHAVTAKRETSGPLAKLAFEVIADSIVNVTALDAQGREVPTACDELVWEITGPAELMGFGNGDPLDRTPEGRPAKNGKRKLYNGKAQTIVRRMASGPWTLTVKAGNGQWAVTGGREAGTMNAGRAGTLK